jgi:crotonobetainyl-CoA:carnitine CoA-transferase CaiB-like acyl-CoA transferase
MIAQSVGGALSITASRMADRSSRATIGDTGTGLHTAIGIPSRCTSANRPAADNTSKWRCRKR